MPSKDVQLELMPANIPGAVPIEVRAEGLSKVLGFYDIIGGRCLPETRHRLGGVATDVFTKTFGIKELVETGMKEDDARQMADDFYHGENQSGYNPTSSSFLQSYIGKKNKSARAEFQALLSGEQPSAQPELPQRIELEPNKVIFPRHSEVIQPGMYLDISDEARITLQRLIKMAGEGISGVSSESQLAAKSSVSAIHQGLYISLYDERYPRAQQLVRVGVTGGPLHPHNVGVVFPSDEFSTVSRSPRDMARHMQARTRAANELNEDRDDVEERVGRAAGHILTDKIIAMSKLRGELMGQRDFLRKMYSGLNTHWRANYKLKNLERHRARTDEMIHDTVEVATINLGYDSTGVKALHGVVNRKLYGGNRTHTEIAQTWQAYITMVGLYIGERVVKLDISTQLSREELENYQPFLDRKEAAL